MKPEQENEFIYQGTRYFCMFNHWFHYVTSFCKMLFDILKGYTSPYLIVLIVSPLDAIITDQVKSLTCMKRFAGCSCEE